MGVQRLAVVGAIVLSSCGASIGAAAPTRTVPPVAPRQTPSTAPARLDLPPASPSSIAARVLSVTDGDTIVLDGIDIGEVHRATGGRKARLIGVDTPEVYGTTECFGRAASSFTRGELDGERVRVTFDVGRTDRYGRALVYLWDDRDRFFNGRIVQEGYAVQLTVPPNVRYAALFSALAREARLAARGLWGAC